MRSDKDVGDVSSTKKNTVIEDDDDGLVHSNEDDGVKDNKDNKCGVEDKTTQEVPNKKGEPKIDLRTSPFPQRFIRHNLDKQFSKFLDHMKDITITIPFMDAIIAMPS